MSMLTRACLTVAASASLAGFVEAQRQIVRTPTGQLFRYNGDTIWTERDSTTTRVVYQGDTITRLMLMNDMVRSTAVYVVNGESALMIDSRDARGTQRTDEMGRSVPSRIVTTDREMLQSAMRMSQIPSLGRNDPPSLPAQPITYAISFGVSMVQHHDTAFYIRGCKERGKLDTTTFVFRGDTTVERLSPRRTFGYGMTASLVGAMFNANVRQSLASRQPRSDVASGPNECASAIPKPLTGDQGVYHLGTVFRYHNDTIWRERDSTITRVVFRKDTIERVYSNNELTTRTTYLLEGDSARIIDFINTDGTRRTQSIGTMSPRMMALTDRTMLETALTAAERPILNPAEVIPSAAIAPDALSNPVPRPPKPGALVTYDVSPDVRMTHLGDTLRYIRGCPPRTKVDTTVFVFFAADSVKRVAPERMFGRSMVASLVGQMHMTGVRQSIAARDPQPPAGLPRAPDLAQQCRR